MRVIVRTCHHTQQARSISDLPRASNRELVRSRIQNAWTAASRPNRTQVTRTRMFPHEGTLDKASAERILERTPKELGSWIGPGPERSQPETVSRPRARIPTATVELT